MKNRIFRSSFLVLVTLFSYTLYAKDVSPYAEKLLTWYDKKHKVHFDERVKTYQKICQDLRDYEFEVKKDISYLGEKRQEKLDIYYPKPVGGELFAAVVDIHGGGWSGGTKDSGREVNICSSLAKKGFVAISIEYLLATDAQPSYPNNIHDCKAAIRWLRKNAKQYHIDPDNIGVIGGSAGGHLTAFMGTSGGIEKFSGKLYPGYSDKVQAIVPLYGFYDLMNYSNLNRNKKSPNVGMPTGIPVESSSMQKRWLGGSKKDKRDNYIQASPMTHVSKDDPPTLLLHGFQDATSPWSESVVFSQKLSEIGVYNEVYLFEKVAHTFDLERSRGKPMTYDVKSIVIGFYARFLKQNKK